MSVPSNLVSRVQAADINLSWARMFLEDCNYQMADKLLKSAYRHITHTLALANDIDTRCIRELRRLSEGAKEVYDELSPFLESERRYDIIQ